MQLELITKREKEVHSGLLQCYKIHANKIYPCFFLIEKHPTAAKYLIINWGAFAQVI